MYQAKESRYAEMKYRRCGRSGLKLPVLSLGLWHNFGGSAGRDSMKDMLCRAFDLGITHFDLANNYGPPPGAAEENFGRILHHELKPWRDELVISTKAGYLMWPGPYGEWGSRKYLLSSLDQSLKRMNLDYVDIFYSHRFDPETPLEETMGALADTVKRGKALYAGISNYPAAETARAYEILHSMGVSCLIHQQRYNMLDRKAEDGVMPTASRLGMGVIAFCPLAQGLLSGKYLNGIPDDSRAAGPAVFLRPEHVEANITRIQKLNAIAKKRGQTLAQMALAWALRREELCSALIGASRCAQIDENVATLNTLDFSGEELEEIDSVLRD